MPVYEWGREEPGSGAVQPIWFTVRVPADASGDALESYRAELDRRLDTLTREADAAVGIEP